MIVKRYKQNYKKNVTGFTYTGFDNIKNFKSKLKSIGLDEDFVPSKGVVYLYLINYLSVVSKDQLCELTHSLKREIHKTIRRLNNYDGSKGSFLVNVQGDINNSEACYYTPAKYTANYLSFYMDDKENIRKARDISNFSHFSKVNDLYLSLFRDSGCTGLTIDFEVEISNGMFSDGDSKVNEVKADGVIGAVFNGVESFLYLELDNGNKGLAALKEKINNYFNVFLHRKSFFEDKVNYFVFRLNKKMYKNQFWLCNTKALNKEEYLINLSRCEELKKLRTEAMSCENEGELQCFVEDNEIDVGEFEFYSNTFTANRNRFCNYLSSIKSEYEYRNEQLKRDEIADYVSGVVKNRVDGANKSVFEEFNVTPFYFDSTDSIYQDITRRNSYAAMYGKLDGKSVLLRTNFICGDSNIDKWFNEFLFKDDDWLIKFANERFGCHFPVDKKREQKYITLNGETLCFSNLHSGLVRGESFTNFVLLMPSISASDHARIVHICESDPAEIEQDLGHEYLVVFVVTDNKKDYEYYRELADSYASEGRILLLSEQIDF